MKLHMVWPRRRFEDMDNIWMEESPACISHTVALELEALVLSELWLVLSFSFY
jgi:hypothetical protein